APGRRTVSPTRPRDRSFERQKPGPVGGVEARAREEPAELSVTRAGLIVAHLRDDALELERITGKQGDPPLPVVQPHGAADHLEDAPTIAAAGQPALAHQPIPLPDVQYVPVVLTGTPFAHRVEADVTHLLGRTGIEPGPDVGARRFRLR